MHRNLLYFILLLLLGCSSEQIVVKNTQNSNEFSDSLNIIRSAESALIKGNIAELKGNFAEAILEYQEALSFVESSGIHYSLAKSYYKINKLPQALFHSKKSVKLDSLNNDYSLLLAGIYLNARLPDSAAIVYDEVIRNDSTNYQAYYSLAQLLEPNKPRKALEIYNKIYKRNGADWNVLLRIADLNERLGNIEQTIKTVEELLTLDPSNLQLQKLLIDSYIKTKKYDLALKKVEDGLTLFPEDIALIEYKGKILIEQDDWEAGSAEYKKLIANDKVSFETKIRIASAFMNEINRDSSLIPIAKNVVEKLNADSSNWQVKAFLGELSLRENQDTIAAGHFSEAAFEAEWNSQLFERLGIILFEAQMIDSAVSQMSKAVLKFPDSFIINIILGLSLSQKNKHEEAERVLNKAVMLNGNDITALHAYGFTLNQLDRQTDAIRYLEKALTLDAGNVQIMGTLGLIYDGLGNYEKSDGIYESALTIDSTNALILNNYAYSLSERDIELDRALEMVQMSIEQEPENPSYLDTIGWIHL
jgi:tetratricopeptide (TPR) repeat protein